MAGRWSSPLAPRRRRYLKQRTSPSPCCTTRPLRSYSSTSRCRTLQRSPKNQRRRTVAAHRGRRPQIACKCDSTTLRRDPGWSSWTGPLDHLFSFFKVSIIITATPTHRNCPAEAWLAADPRRAAEVRSSRPAKRCAEGWSTGPLQGRPPPIADLTRAMCVSGDSVHFRSGPPPAAEVVQWTRHLVQGGPLQPSARPDLSRASRQPHRREP